MGYGYISQFFFQLSRVGLKFPDSAGISRPVNVRNGQDSCFDGGFGPDPCWAREKRSSGLGFMEIRAFLAELAFFVLPKSETESVGVVALRGRGGRVLGVPKCWLGQKKMPRLGLGSAVGVLAEISRSCQI